MPRAIDVFTPPPRDGVAASRVGVGRLAQPGQDAAVQLPHVQAQAAHPRRGLVAADAAGAVHRHRTLRRAPRRRVRLDVGGEVAEVVHLRIERAVEMAQAELEVVAVVQQHDVVALQQRPPFGWCEVAGVALVGRRQHVGQPERDDLGLEAHLQAAEGLGGAGAVLEVHAAQRAGEHAGALQRGFEVGDRFGGAGDGAVDAFVSDDDAALEVARKRTQGLRRGDGVGERGEAVEGAVQRRIGHRAAIFAGACIPSRRGRVEPSRDRRQAPSSSARDIAAMACIVARTTKMPDTSDRAVPAVAMPGHCRRCLAFRIAPGASRS